MNCGLSKLRGFSWAPIPGLDATLRRDGGLPKPRSSSTRLRRVRPSRRTSTGSSSSTSAVIRDGLWAEKLYDRKFLPGAGQVALAALLIPPGAAGGIFHDPAGAYPPWTSHGRLVADAEGVTSAASARTTSD